MMAPVVGPKPIADRLRVAESPGRRSAGVRRRHPLPLELAGQHVEMKGELVIDVAGDVGKPDADRARVDSSGSRLELNRAKARHGAPG